MAQRGEKISKREKNFDDEIEGKRKRERNEM